MKSTIHRFICYEVLVCVHELPRTVGHIGLQLTLLR